jgi:toxin ParE1/3/4
MARFRLSRPAQTDLARILSASLEQWGADGKRRYAVTLATAMRKLASDPRDRGELQPGLRSLHLRYAGVRRRDAQVRRPVHVLYYRVIRAGLVEIVRILHARMEPARWLETGSGPEE